MLWHVVGPGGQWTGSDGYYVYHGFAGLGVLGAAYFHGGWWGILAVVVGSFIGAFILVHIFRSAAQFLNLLSLPAVVVWYVVSLIETCSGNVCTPLFRVSAR